MCRVSFDLSYLWVISAVSYGIPLLRIAQEGLKEEVVITENEIGEMYAHLTTEYDKKIKEILSRRSISLDENDQDRASQSTPVSVNLATDTEHGEEEEEDESTEAAAAKAHFNRGITIAELNEKLAARALTENPGFLPNGPLSVKGSYRISDKTCALLE